MECLHMSGAGNDCMVIDARGMELDFAKLALQLCGQTGADGFMAVGESDIADFRLHFYNSDGTRGEMCGNGARCICKYAYDHGIAGAEMTVQTDAGLVKGWRLEEDRYKVQLNNPGELILDVLDGVDYVELGDPGVPHSVEEISDLTWEQTEQRLPLALSRRNDPVFPKGVNVNFYHWVDETTVRVLTYERGVEDYTLACGTGCASIGVSLWQRGKLPGGHLTALCRGGALGITVSGTDGKVDTVLLEGPAEVLISYDIALTALL